jgi:DNA-binding SARP family transcriptional activator
MRAIGCRLVASRATSLLAGLAPGTARAVRVETLGGFRVLRDGTPVPPAAWGPPEARDLLKLLIARRGRAVQRAEIRDVLWPELDEAASDERIDKAVAALTSVLDERGEVDAPVVTTEGDAVRLDLDRLDLDLTSFLDDAETGIRLLRDRRDEDAIERLVKAEAVYAGDFLEEDADAEWARSVRDEARVTYVLVGAALADHATEAGEPDTAVRYLLRILAHDPYDEGAHLRLVAGLATAGRHGDARRHYRTYCERMEEIGVEPAPLPSVPGPDTAPVIT